MVHSSRLHLHRADMEGEIFPHLVKKGAENSITNYQVFECFKDIRKSNGVIRIQIEWKGLPDEIDRTWGALLQVFEDLPGQFEDYMNNSSERALLLRAQAQCIFPNTFSRIFV